MGTAVDTKGYGPLTSHSKMLLRRLRRDGFIANVSCLGIPDDEEVAAQESLIARGYAAYDFVGGIWITPNGFPGASRMGRLAVLKRGALRPEKLAEEVVA